VLLTGNLVLQYRLGCLQVTFADTLGAAKHQEDSEVNSKNEAKKLAFYLFWNIKPSFNRWASPCTLDHQVMHCRRVLRMSSTSHGSSAGTTVQPCVYTRCNMCWSWPAVWSLRKSNSRLDTQGTLQLQKRRRTNNNRVLCTKHIHIYVQYLYVYIHIYISYTLPDS